MCNLQLSPQSMISAAHDCDSCWHDYNDYLVTDFNLILHLARPMRMHKFHPPYILPTHSHTNNTHTNPCYSVRVRERERDRQRQLKCFIWQRQLRTLLSWYTKREYGEQVEWHGWGETEVPDWKYVPVPVWQRIHTGWPIQTVKITEF